MASSAFSVPSSTTGGGGVGTPLRQDAASQSAVAAPGASLGSTAGVPTVATAALPLQSSSTGTHGFNVTGGLAALSPGTLAKRQRLNPPGTLGPGVGGGGSPSAAQQDGTAGAPGCDRCAVLAAENSSLREEVDTLSAQLRVFQSPPAAAARHHHRGRCVDAPRFGNACFLPQVNTNVWFLDPAILPLLPTH